MANWITRLALDADAPALAQCIDRAYAIYADALPDLPAVSEGIAGDIAENLVWVVELDNRIIGGLVLVAGTHHLTLANVAVDPDQTGKGIGKALLDLAVSEARRLNKVEMRLSTHVQMPGNVALYTRLGWQETGRAGNKVHMSKPVQSAQSQ